MFTVCPKCTLTLVVTTVDLRAGQGYVRCGRCSNVFNALIALREGDPAGGTSETAKRRLLETTPKSIEPAPGVGVAMDPEPDSLPGPESTTSEPELEAESEQELEPQPERDAEAEAEAESEAAHDTAPEGTPEEIVLSAEAEAEPGSAEESALEFDAAATDVSEIFISPSEAEHDTASGNYEAVVLQVDRPAPPRAVEVADDPSHADTIARGEWSLLDDDEPPADDESVIEESPLAYDDQPDPAPEPAAQPDAAWVEQMFAEAEAQAIENITRGDAKPARTDARAVATDAQYAGAEAAEETAEETAEEAAYEAAEDTSDRTAEETADDTTRRAADDSEYAQQAARLARKSTPTPPSDAALAPLLGPAATQRPPWQYIAGVVGLVLLFGLQVAHFNRQSLAVSPTVGPLVTGVYGLFGATVTPRWDLTAYSVRQLGAESEDADGTRLRVRLSLHNESTRVQPFPLLRLTLSDRFGNPVATRDLEPADYLPKKFAKGRLLEPDQRIDAEVHVLDPAKAAMGFVIDACLRATNGNIGCAADARARARTPS